MEFIADLHIHSYLSRATAKNLNLEHLNLWAQLKGITVVGTGDFTHPQWFSELSKKLEPAENGLFKLRPEFAAQTDQMVPPRCKGPVRFMLSVEISSIYKKDGKTRKVHNVVFLPDLELAEKFNQRLGRIGNIGSDGRPILGLACRSLLEIVLETSEDAFLIPAHIWTPWFSVLGSKSGFDSLEECFEDLTPHIFAVETGLSSDPAMNWRVSSLDGLTLVSNSDAHSPSNLGREANLFDTDLSYFAIRDALKTGDPKRFLGTLEYFAEEGKYHFDGHRKCGARLSPAETRRHQGLCPICGRPVTIGVMYRVEELGDRKAGVKPKGAHPYTSLLPLTDVLSQVFQVGAKSKKVTHAYRMLVERLGPEFEILRKIPLEALDRHGPALLAEAINRMRNNQVYIAPGYDGEFGTVSLFDEQERSQLFGQKRLFGGLSKAKIRGRRETISLIPHDEPLQTAHLTSTVKEKTFVPPEQAPLLREDHFPKKGLLDRLNEAQREAVQYTGGPLLIVAGPGTGKTLTLTHRIAYLISERVARPEQVLAVTFTNKAAQEMAERLSKILDDSKALKGVTIKTFHGLCLDIISLEANALGIRNTVSILNESDRTQFVKAAMQRTHDDFLVSRLDLEGISDTISKVKQCLLSPDDDLAGLVPEPLLDQFPSIYGAYQEILDENHLLDFDDLIYKTVRLFETHRMILRKYQQRFCFISVDEYQDVNYAQYRLIRLLAPEGHDICVIGDPDQAIYGFRGADVQYFHRFCEDFPGAKRILLKQNYRSTETILRASGQVIGVDDTGRGEKGIWSGICGAKVLTVAELPTQRAEAEYIVKTIEQAVGGISHFSMDSRRIDRVQEKKERSFSDFAVLYRIKEQGKALDEAFARSGIPYQMVGIEKLQNRKGITELISYLKLGWSIACDLDVERVLNFPSRGIGPSTVHALKQWTKTTGHPLISALEHSAEISGLKRGPRSKLGLFSKDLSQLKETLNGKSVYEQIHHILDRFSIMDAMSGHEAFKEDLNAFLGLSRSFEDRADDFLAHLALEQAQDLYDPAAEKVPLMTMHAAKGLEFPVVFIAGCEDGVIPYRRKNSEEEDLLEERRLFYVALTRAQEKIYLTHVKRRQWFGQRTVQHISPFLEAVDKDLKQHKKPFSPKSDPKTRRTQLSLFQL
ncbi:MAG: UvrD-helicase domain-containing protein [Deltaproteobacteria bacterium]|nr:UvrD-helicase domain-containing protein [Deltaproteobacteria bacterium]MBW2018493.1 UvrD-helicase domain-containing protein [Deltaproteobacteria bacterium]MBW2073228.1 UvrD-helicase domain-containing protein [Deltaproteobacteria bacterium]